MAMLDAYASNELEPVEREQIESHLPLCQECQQWLVDIAQFHSLLQQQPAHAISSKMADTALDRYNSRHSSRLAVSILASITNNQKGREKQEESMETLQPLFIQKQEKKHKTRHQWRFWVFAAAVLCISVIVIGSFYSEFVTLISGNGEGHGHGAPSFWTLNQKQTMVSDGTDVFALKEVVFTAQAGVRFFYTSHSVHQNEIPQIKIMSVLPSQPQKTIQLPVKVQIFGQVNVFNVGMVQVPYMNRSGQTITFQIKFSDKTSTLSLSPLVQNDPEGGMAGDFPVDQNVFPDVTWNVPSSASVDVAFFQSRVTGQTKGTSRLFLRLDNPVKVITEAEYSQFVSQGQQPSTSCKDCRPPLSITAIYASATAQAHEKNH
jgi:hypothetical protein